MTTIDPSAALHVADDVLAELNTRGGFPAWWHGSIPDDDIREEIRWAIARAIAEARPPAPEPPAVEPEVQPDLSVGWRGVESTRALALQAAAIAWQGIGSATNDDIVCAAREFEAYLRGER